jgi:hypothetical protein
MNPRTLIQIARPLKRLIGAHVHMIGQHNLTDKDYQRAQSDSDQAVSTAKYLICHLVNQHDAVVFASAVGMPGYINLR